MAKQSAAALRAARQRRLASTQKSPPSTQSQSSETRTASPTSETSAPSLPEKMVSAVVDPSMVSKTASIDLFLVGEETESPNWVVFANGRPAAEIRLEDQEEPQRIAQVFTTNRYAESIKEAARQVDFDELLAGCRARPFVASVSGSDAYKQITAQAEKSASEEMRKAKANLRDSALNMLNLVVVAQSKNFLKQNPLKEELFDRMVSAGVGEKQASAIIESAYQAKGPEHFEACFKQAFKWMDLHPEALAELEETIADTPQMTPVVADAHDDEIRSASVAPFSHTSVPLETRASYASEEDGDSRAQIRAALGFSTGPRR